MATQQPTPPPLPSYVMSQDQPGPSLDAIRKMTDAEIVQRHDERTEYFIADLAIRDAYRDELDRRASARATRWSIRLAALTVVLSALAVVLAAIALFRP